MEDLKDEVIPILKDVFIALLILGIILSSLYIYTGRWPPMVVIESPSMSHCEGDPPASRIGVIDTGDIVAVKSIRSRDNIISYVEGRDVGHRSYGQYGDVIIFRPDGSEDKTPVIHRPVLYIEYNETADGFDAPSLEHLTYGEEWESDEEGDGVYGLTENIIIYDYGHRDVLLEINLGDLADYRHDGYITMGDNNIRSNKGIHDQSGGMRNINEPVKIEWIEGKARGELPWFGSIKLLYISRIDSVPNNTWRNLVVSIILIIALPMVLEYVIDYYKKYKNDDNRKNTHKKDNKK